MYTQREEFRPSTSESQTGNCGRPSVIPLGGTAVRQVPKCADLVYAWSRTACREKPKSRVIGWSLDLQEPV